MPSNPSTNKPNDMEEYIPGVCNIGKEEVKKRRTAAVFAALLSTLIVFGLLHLHADKLWRFLVFFPSTSFFIGVQQWSNKFCIGFGLKGVFNFKELGNMVPVEQQEMLKADRAKAIKMITIGVIAALIITIGFYLVP